MRGKWSDEDGVGVGNQAVEKKNKWKIFIMVNF
jgi:hypothetical protein